MIIINNLKMKVGWENYKYCDENCIICILN